MVFNYATGNSFYEKATATIGEDMINIVTSLTNGKLKATQSQVKKWREAMESVVNNNYSSGHRSRLRKWFPLAILPKARIEIFEKLVEGMEWSPTTQATYFACLQTTLHILGIQKSVGEELKM